MKFSLCQGNGGGISLASDRSFFRKKSLHTYVPHVSIKYGKICYEVTPLFHESMGRTNLAKVRLLMRHPLLSK